MLVGGWRVIREGRKIRLANPLPQLRIATVLNRFGFYAQPHLTPRPGIEHFYVTACVQAGGGRARPL